MPVDTLKCVNCVYCVNMDCHVEEGYKTSEFSDYDFAEDAFDFECQLSEARDVRFEQVLTEPLAVGSHILCTGTPSDDLPWFAINIGSGAPGPDADIAVHFNVRVPQCYVVRNTRRLGKWGIEETTAFKSFPFKMGRPFTIEAVVAETETLWAVDGEHYCSFAHRSPEPLGAAWLQVTGVRDANLSVQKTEEYPMLAPQPEEVPFRASLDAPPLETEPIWHPNVSALLPNGIPPGHQLVIHGRLRPVLHSFAINLQEAAREWPPPRTPLHVNVRAHDESTRTRQLVIFNSRDTVWGAERRQRTAALVPGTKCCLRIVHGPSEWVVWADGLQIGALEHRVAPALARSLRVRGDLFPDQLFVCPSDDLPSPECAP